MTKLKPAQNVRQISFGTFSHGSRTVGTVSALALTTASVVCNRGVTVKAARANSGNVYVGSTSGVTGLSAEATDGYELDAGEEIHIPVNNTNKIFVRGGAAGQKVTWMKV